MFVAHFFTIFNILFKNGVITEKKFFGKKNWIFGTKNFFLNNYPIFGQNVKNGEKMSHKKFQVSHIIKTLKNGIFQNFHNDSLAKFWTWKVLSQYAF